MSNHLFEVTGVLINMGSSAIFGSPTQKNVGGTQYAMLAQSAGQEAGGGASQFIAIGVHGGTLHNYKASFWVSPDQQRPGLNIGWANTVTAPVFGAVFAGNVGIGNAAPRTLLDVGTSSAAFAASATDTRLYVSRAGATNVVIRNNADNVEMVARVATNMGLFGVATNHALALYSNNTERLWITADGNVGIGNSNPGAVLDVSGQVRVRSGNSDATFNTPGGLAIKDPGSGSATLTFHQSNGDRVALILAGDNRMRIDLLDTVDGGALDIRKGTTNRLRINKNGDVAIGVASATQPQEPLARLHVRDGISFSRGNMFFKYVDGVAATPVKILEGVDHHHPVGNVFTGIVSVSIGAGTVRTGGLIVVPRNGTFPMTIDGSNAIEFAVSSDGHELTVVRTAGSLTYNVAVLGITA